MNIFQMKTQPHGIERIDLFLRENFVCIGYPNVGDLTNVDKDEIRERLRTTYGYTSSQLGNHLGIVNAFVNTMKKGDIVLITENDWVHIGKLGDYKYEQQYESEGMCHRRYVTWLGKVEKHNLNEYVRELLRNRSIVTKFKHPYDLAEIERVLNGQISTSSTNRIDNEIISKALDVLERALESENEEIRVKAALGLLKYYN